METPRAIQNIRNVIAIVEKNTGKKVIELTMSADTIADIVTEIKQELAFIQTDTGQHEMKCVAKLMGIPITEDNKLEYGVVQWSI